MQPGSRRERALSWVTTMGHNFASAFYVAILTGLVAVFGSIKGGSVPIGIAAIILGIIGAIFVRNTPQERGLNPDNVSDEVYKKNTTRHLTILKKQAVGRQRRC